MQLVTLFLLIGCLSITSADIEEVRRINNDVQRFLMHGEGSPIGSNEHNLTLSDECLGSTYTAAVWKARFDGIKVAVKLFTDVKNMNQEKAVYEALNATNNPGVENYGIPNLYYVGQMFQKHPIIVITCFDESLFDRWQTQNHRFNMYSTLQVLLQSVKALKYIHDRKVVHNDIEPHNIFLHGDRVFVGDFDRATLNGEHHDAATVTFASSSWWANERRAAMDDLESLVYTIWFIEGINLPVPDGSKMAKLKTKIQKQNFVLEKCQRFKRGSHLAYAACEFICKDQLLSRKYSPKYEKIIDRLEAATIETRQTTFEWLSSPESAPSSSSSSKSKSAS